MTFTYTWANAEQNLLVEAEDNGTIVRWIPADPANTAYREFLASGETAADYVEPPEPPEPTAEEKLANAGLTVDELKELLGI
jgi:hypothetical protein